MDKAMNFPAKTRFSGVFLLTAHKYVDIHKYKSIDGTQYLVGKKYFRNSSAICMRHGFLPEGIQPGEGLAPQDLFFLSLLLTSAKNQCWNACPLVSLKRAKLLPFIFVTAKSGLKIRNYGLAQGLSPAWLSKTSQCSPRIPPGRTLTYCFHCKN